MNTDNESLYVEIADTLFKRWQNAAFGPAHVCLDDENWDAYQHAINMIHLILARRAMLSFQFNPEDADDHLRLWDIDAYRTCDACEWYADHSTQELADTLYALELVRWHEQGNQGEPPMGKAQ